LTKKEPIDTAMLAKQAQNSQEKEAFTQIEKTQSYRIGVGARATPPAPSFFLEVIINLSTETGKVDLQRLENILRCLKKLKARGYALTYEDNNCISCETSIYIQNPNKECREIRKLIQEIPL
jgi:hypothetical protein